VVKSIREDHFYLQYWRIVWKGKKHPHFLHCSSDEQCNGENGMDAEKGRLQTAATDDWQYCKRNSMENKSMYNQI